MKKKIKELSIEELRKGYVCDRDRGTYSCIFCGESFEEGVIYNREGLLLSAERSAVEHVNYVHSGSFEALLSMEKDIHGLSATQKKILRSIYHDADIKVTCQKMGISPATYRSHKFNLQRVKRESKVFIALIEEAEADVKPNVFIKLDGEDQLDISPYGEGETPREREPFTGNSLHPYFTHCKYK